MAKIKNPLSVMLQVSSGKFASLVDHSITTVTAEDLAGVTVIGANAFFGCNSLISVVIPDGVISLESGCFQDCSKMTSIVIPNSCIRFGTYCLRANRITTVNIPEGTKEIPYGMLNYAGQLLTVTIPSTVTTIGGIAFSNCSSLRSVTVLATNPPTLYDPSVFLNTNNCPIYVPAASVDAYKAATNWAALSDRIFAIQ